MTGNVIETVMGAVVLAVAGWFLFFAYSTSPVRAVQGYEVTAQFDSVAGIRDGSDVRIAGVKVGSIVSETLDPKTFLATVRMSIDPAYQLPDDTLAEIISAGLLAFALLAGLTSFPLNPIWKESWSGPTLGRAALALKPWLPPAFAERLRYH